VSAAWVTFLFEAANFLLLAAVLGWLFFRPVRDALERKRSELESQGRAAADARAEAERAVQEARARRVEVENSLEDLRARLQREAERERDRILEEARAQMQRERESLKEELVSRRCAQARSLARDAALAAGEIVVRLLEAIRGPNLEQALLGAACRELAQLRSAGPLAPLVIESARELDDQTIAFVLDSAAVSAADAARRVDPELVAGLRVLTARGLIDASAAGLAAHAERVLTSRLEREDTSHD
jgi:F-type H+-transporting ATPase subunit b